MPKLILSFVVLMTIFGLTTTVKAGVPPFMWQYIFEYNIISDPTNTEIPYNQPSLFIVGFATTEEEIESGVWPKNPFNLEAYIDGERIVLRRFQFFDKDGSIGGYPGVHWWYFYQVYDPCHFEKGYHNIIVKPLVQKPYAGSEVHGWRIFVNYYGDPDEYGPIGIPLIFNYYIHVS
ncbi:MAG: hypothetical protein ACFE8L_09920 [Candidatus Hodarchaeota archaeon]